MWFAATFADIGLIVPLLLGAVYGGGLNPSIVFCGFGAFCVVTGAWYRLPVPAQPMKVIAALAMSGTLNADNIAVSGIMIGVILLFFGMTGLASRLKRFFPQTILQAIQLILAVQIIFSALNLVSSMAGQITAIGGTVAFIFLRYISKPAIAVFCLFGIGLLATAMNTPFTSSNELKYVFDTLEFYPRIITTEHFVFVATEGVLPQIVLTMTNALFLTSLLLQENFPKHQKATSENHLAISSGLLNCILAPIGALPMCHGAGGVVAYKEAGARDGRPVVLLGVIFLAFGFLQGSQTIEFLQIIPKEVYAILMLVTAWSLIDRGKFQRSTNFCRFTILTMLAFGVGLSITAALVAGFALEKLRPSKFTKRA